MSRPPGLATAPSTSATATTRIPSDDSKKASGPPTLPKPWTTTREPASDKPSSANTRRTQRTTPLAVAPVWSLIPPTESGLPVTAAGID